MFFTRTSHGLNISPDSILTAKCECCNREWKDASIRLDDFLGNEGGFFLIGGRDFSKSASNVQVVSGDSGTTILCAKLRKRDGDWQTDSIDLDMFIDNTDGSLCL
ncbi:Cyanovirin-N [Glonium stellatum]|uniref:Cyanovirin-N n=1 Tax=Glonium stellatum TaxID=574774 RepID=A0A8E2JQ54_9PEZI|nr:Cyanovirin-N [Glonium stellatum]